MFFTVYNWIELPREIIVNFEDEKKLEMVN